MNIRLSPMLDDTRQQMNSASHAEALRHALYGVAIEDRASCCRSSGGSSSSNSNYDEDDADGNKRDEDGHHYESFEEHRRMHSDNEHKKAKCWSRSRSIELKVTRVPPMGNYYVVQWLRITNTVSSASLVQFCFVSASLQP